MRALGGELLGESSWGRALGGELLGESSWGRALGGELLGESSWGRALGGELLGESSCGRALWGIALGGELLGGGTNMPKPMTHNNYDKLSNIIKDATKHVAEESMKSAADELKDREVVADIGVSVDGSWQKRGFSSLNGVATVYRLAVGKYWTLK